MDDDDASRLFWNLLVVAGHDGRQAWFGRKCNYLPGPKAIMDHGMDHGSLIMGHGDVWKYGSMDVSYEFENEDGGGE